MDKGERSPRRHSPPPGPPHFQNPRTRRGWSMRVSCPKSFFACIATACFWLAAPAQGQITVYETGFESTEAPPFANGNLAGQNGWISTDVPPTAGRGIVQSTLALTGSRSALLDASVTSNTDWYWEPLNYSVPVALNPVVQV